MKTLGKLIVILLLLVVLAAGLIPLFVSIDDVVAKINESVKNSTGRELSIAGEKHFSVIPSLVLTLEDVRFSNMPGGSAKEMATMKKLDVHIPWLSIFSGDLVVDKFVIEQPAILLETNKQGVNNWTFPKTAGKSAAEQGQAESNDGGSGGTKLPESFDINLGDIEIKNGVLTIIDHTSGDSKKLEKLGLDIELPSLRKPLQVKGTVTYMAQTFNLTTTVETPAKAIENSPFNVELDLDSELLKLNYKGEVKNGGKQVAGHLALLTDSVKKLLKWQNIPLQAKHSAFNRFSLDADIAMDGNVIGFDGLDAKFDALAFKGKSQITLGKVATVELDLDLGELDLNPYLPKPASNTPPPSDGPAEPIVWDDTPIDLAGLNAVNADIKIKSTALRARDIKLGANQFSLKLSGGRLDLKMEKFNAYEGSGTGQVVVNAKTKPYRIDTRFDLDGIDANPLLIDAAKFDKLLGKGSIDWQLTTSGQSQKDFVESLNGKFGINLADGAVKGVNLAAIARSAQNLMTGNLSGVSLDKDFDAAEKTDFASMQASFDFTNGVGVNKDMAMLNPFVEVTGAGQLDLVKTNIDYKVKAKLVASMEGQASNTGKSGLTIPIKIKGPFHQVKVRPDISSGAKDKAKDKLKDTVKDKFKDLFGG